MKVALSLLAIASLLLVAAPATAGPIPPQVDKEFCFATIAVVDPSKSCVGVDFDHVNDFCVRAAGAEECVQFIGPVIALDVKEVCVNYAYVADYQWYYVCANPSDSGCVVSTMRSNGVDRWYDCYGVDAVALDAFPVCSEEIGDLDHRYRFCADNDLDCPVYQEFQSGGRTCFP